MYYYNPLWSQGSKTMFLQNGGRQSSMLGGGIESWEELVFMAIHHPSQYPTWYSILSPWLACREHNEVFFNAPRPFQSLIAVASLAC